MKHGLVRFSLLGMVVPLTYFLANFVSAEATNRVFRLRGAEEILIALWPGSLLLIGTGPETGYFPQALSVVSNVIYYVLIACVLVAVRNLTFGRKT